MTTGRVSNVTSRRILLLSPLALAGVGAWGAYSILGRMRQGTFDPHDVPSQLIGKRVPDFAALPPLEPGGPTFGSAELHAPERPMIVNFFASWCIPCVVEAPTLLTLAQSDVPIWGIAYKDKPDAARAFLARHGNPYSRIVLDEPGRVAIDWGVYGVPESYLIDKSGIVRWREAGPITEDVLNTQLQPALRSVA